jgi:hypothetical protein
MCLFVYDDLPEPTSFPAVLGQGGRGMCPCLVAVKDVPALSVVVATNTPNREPCTGAHHIDYRSEVETLRGIASCAQPSHALREPSGPSILL